MIDLPANAPTALVVEDEWLVATTMLAALNSKGVRVLGPVGTVTAAQALIQAETPDVALLDYRLDGHTTEPLLDPLDAAGVPIVVITGYGAENLPPRFARYEVVEKPFDFRTVKLILEKLGVLERPLF